MNPLARDFNTKSLLAYVTPSIMMMIFFSTYTIVDGLFVSNLVGEAALSAVNIVWPVFNLILALGQMFASGSTAVMGRLMGQGREEEARAFLTVIYLIGLGLGGAISLVVQIWPEEIVHFLGVNADLYPYAMDYLGSLGLFGAAFFLQVFFQAFSVLAGRPNLGLYTCLAGGMLNIGLDYLFIAPNMMDMGITGAGLATGLGNCVPTLVGLAYFAFHRKGSLYFVRPVMHWRRLWQSMGNGLSELVSQLSTGVTIFLFNMALLDLAGTSGVASITVILYVKMMQTALYFGYAIGVAPIISYQYGAQDWTGLRNVLKISFGFIALSSLAVIVGSMLLDDPAVGIFISPSSPTFAVAKEGLRLFSIAYLFMGVNIFMSAFFTALSNGMVSALLSLSRTLVFLVGCLLVLPGIWDITGVWLAVPLAEGLTFLLSILCYRVYFQRAQLELEKM